MASFAFADEKALEKMIESDSYESLEQEIAEIYYQEEDYNLDEENYFDIAEERQLWANTFT